MVSSMASGGGLSLAGSGGSVPSAGYGYDNDGLT
jgi:hypothetical protein